MALATCIRRAKLITKVLASMTALINDGELIVGCKTPPTLGLTAVSQVLMQELKDTVSSYGFMVRIGG